MYNTKIIAMFLMEKLVSALSLLQIMNLLPRLRRNIPMQFVLMCDPPGSVLWLSEPFLMQ